MGTRGTLRIRMAGKQIVLYNQFDSYPSGLGVDFLTSIQNLIEKYGMDRFLQLVQSVRIVSYDEEPTEEDIAKLAPYTDLTVGEQSTSSWYCLTRKFQGDLMGMLEAGYMFDMDEDMVQEYNYVLDLDRRCVFMFEYDEEDDDEATPLSDIPALIEKWKSW